MYSTDSHLVAHGRVSEAVSSEYRERGQFEKERNLSAIHQHWGEPLIPISRSPTKKFSLYCLLVVLKKAILTTAYYTVLPADLLLLD